MAQSRFRGGARPGHSGMRVLVWLRSGPFHQQIWVAPEAARHGEVTIKARQPQAATGRYATSRAVNI